MEWLAAIGLLAGSVVVFALGVQVGILKERHSRITRDRIVWLAHRQAVLDSTEPDALRGVGQ